MLRYSKKIQIHLLVESSFAGFSGEEFDDSGIMQIRILNTNNLCFAWIYYSFNISF